MPDDRVCPKCGSQIPTHAPGGICPKCLMEAGLATASNANHEIPATLGSGFVPPKPEDLAGHFPQLEILELLGRGGMGAVYKARQRELDRLVAIKILPPEVGADPAFAERFAREARALAMLGHKNIVGVHDFGQADGLYFLMMEYVDGANLRQVIETGGLESEKALAIIPQICEALQFAHDQGIVHRDIKPENILLTRQGEVKIADFGLAKMFGQAPAERNLTGTHQVMGTAHYMAPEQMQQTHSVDHRADIYSLGVVFYELLTGQLPLGRFDPPSRKVNVDVRLDEVVLRSLECEPGRRYQRASEVKTDIESIAETGEPKFATSPADVPAVQMLNAPSIGLIIAGTINLLCMLPWVALAYIGKTTGNRILGGGEEQVMIWLFLSVVAGIPILFAAFKMRHVEAHRLCVFGAITAVLPMTPGALIGIPMGIWALVVLTRKDVIVDFEVGPVSRVEESLPPKANMAYEDQPRLSRKAIFGACWAPLFFLVALMSMITVPSKTVHTDPSELTHRAESSIRSNVARHDSATPSGPAWWQWVLMMTVLPLGLTAPFGTTVLGLMAISNIRHSRGRLAGMPLALADALFYPLLILDGLIVAAAICLSMFIVMIAGAAGFRGLNVMVTAVPVLLIALPTCVLADMLLVRAAWRRSISGMK